jgi:hypothetical protein
MPEESPKLFISYSWGSHEHEQWVLKLATELVESGVDVILDKWDLREGHDAIKFMEQMVADPDVKKVAIICNRSYAEKADGRNGGVGTETQIITPEIYKKADQSKFVAIIAEKDAEGNPYLPIYYKSRVYIDLSDRDLYAKNYEQLERWIYDQPLFVKPELGKKPAYLNESATLSLGTSGKFRRALDAIKNNKENCTGALNEYFETFTVNLERFRLEKGEGEFDDKVKQIIEEFLPYRNEAIGIFLALAQYRNTTETHRQLHRFFEGLIPYMDRPEAVTSYRDWDYDNFRFIIHELFLYAIASLLKYECFDAVSYLLRHRYYCESSIVIGKMIGFPIMRREMKSLQYRNDRLHLQRVSLRADWLFERSKASGLSFSEIMQADFVLYMRGCFEIFRNQTNDFRIWWWWPETLLYSERHYGPFEIFARAESIEYFDSIKCLFEIENKDDFLPIFQAYQEQKLHIPKWNFHYVNPSELLGYEQLATRP